MNNVYECITCVTHPLTDIPKQNHTQTYLLCLASFSLILSRNHWGFLDPVTLAHYRFSSLYQQVLVHVQSLQLPGLAP